MTTHNQKKKLKDTFFNKLPKEVEIENLVNMGFVQITAVGEENMYFEKDGKEYFCKVGN
jgi:hypothetical protein